MLQVFCGQCGKKLSHRIQIHRIDEGGLPGSAEGGWCGLWLPTVEAPSLSFSAAVLNALKASANQRRTLFRFTSDSKTQKKLLM